MIRIASLISTFLLIFIASSAMGNAQGDDPQVTLGRTLHAPLQNTDGTTVAVALIAESNDEISGSAVGLAPGLHGIHIHETGICDPASDPAFSSAGEHYNPTGAEHGEHAGDLGNVTADESGISIFQGTITEFALDDLIDADGSAVIIHAEEDENDPAGESYGARIACGVLSEPEAAPSAVSGPASPVQTATVAAATEPTSTEPAVTEPAVTEPVATEPAVTEPAATEPVATEP